MKKKQRIIMRKWGDTQKPNKIKCFECRKKNIDCYCSLSGGLKEINKIVVKELEA